MMSKVHIALVTSVTLFTGYAAAKYYLIRFSTEVNFEQALLYAGIVLIPNIASVLVLVISDIKQARKVYLLIAVYCIVIFNTFAYVDTTLTGVYTPGDMGVEHIMNPLAAYGMMFTLLPSAIGLTLSFPGKAQVKEKRSA